MVYLLLILLGLVVLVQSYLLFSLMKGQRNLQMKVNRLLRTQQRSTPLRKTSTERGRTR